VVKSPQKAKPNPKAEKQRLLNLLVTLFTLVRNFLNYFLTNFKPLKSIDIEKPGQPVPGFSILSHILHQLFIPPRNKFLG
jgi:hypothetical protein